MRDYWVGDYIELEGHPSVGLEVMRVHGQSIWVTYKNPILAQEHGEWEVDPTMIRTPGTVFEVGDVVRPAEGCWPFIVMEVTPDGMYVTLKHTLGELEYVWSYDFPKWVMMKKARERSPRVKLGRRLEL